MRLSKENRMKRNPKVVSIEDKQRALALIPCPQPAAESLRYLITRVHRVEGPPPIVIVEQVYELLQPLTNVEILKKIPRAADTR